MAKYECSRQGDCQITTATRNICKYCRYQKCLDVGMKPDGAYTDAVTSCFVVACTYIHTLLTADTSGQLRAYLYLHCAVLARPAENTLTANCCRDITRHEPLIYDCVFINGYCRVIIRHH